MMVPSGIGIETSFPLRSTIPKAERLRRKRSPCFMAPFFITDARPSRSITTRLLKSKMMLPRELFQATPRAAIFCVSVVIAYVLEARIGVEPTTGRNQVA
jgi:hypothetical protein